MKNKRFKLIAMVVYVCLLVAGFLTFALGNLLPSQELLISLFVLILTASYLYANRKRPDPK